MRWWLGLFVAGLVLGVAFLVFSWMQQNRQLRLNWLLKTESQGNEELSRQLLAEYMRDFPNDPALEGQWKLEFEAQAANAAKAKAEKEAFQAQVRRLENDNTKLQNRIGTLENSVQQSLFDREQQDQLAKARQGEDFLNLIFHEKPVDQKYSIRELEQKRDDALSAIQNRRWTDAEANSKFILQSRPNDAKAASLWIYAAVRDSSELSNIPPSLAPVVETLLHRDPKNFFCLYSSAVIYQNTGNWTLSEERFRLAMEANPTSVDTKVRLIAVLMKVNKVAEAKELALELWNGGKKDDPTALLVWESLASESDQVRSKFLVEWQNSVQTSALPELYEGDMAVQNDDMVAAIRLFQASLEKKATTPTRQRLADAYFTVGRFSEAAIDYRLLLRAKNPQLAYDRDDYIKDAGRLVTAEIEEKNWADAIFDGTSILQVFPDLSTVRLFVGRSYLTIGEAAKAADVLEPGTQTSEGTAMLDDLLQAYWTLKQYDKIRSKLNAVENWPMDDAARQRLKAWRQRLDDLGKKS